MDIPHWSEGELPPEPCARIIADSVGPSGRRLTTFEMKFHRFVLAEVNTHTLFSRNSASSRAIPLRSKREGVRKGMLDRLEDNGPAMPVRWPREQAGMQGADEEVDTKLAEIAWHGACESAINSAEILASLGVHKSVVNRLLEPFNWHTATITAESWEGFFRQRSWHRTKDAQPEFATVATMVEDLYNASTPREVGLNEWHLPYIRDEERGELETVDLCRVSSARCARTSYLTHTGKKDYEEDINLFNRLSGNEPPHASPLQHVATPDPTNECVFVISPAEYGLEGEPHQMVVPILGNYRGWVQFRHIVLGF